ncbi:hypothetical protein CHS0354_011704, partial [Potamilus streckersoni]
MDQWTSAPVEKSLTTAQFHSWRADQRASKIPRSAANTNPKTPPLETLGPGEPMR